MNLPTPNPSQEGNSQQSEECLLPSQEGNRPTNSAPLLGGAGGEFKVPMHFKKQWGFP